MEPARLSFHNADVEILLFWCEPLVEAKSFTIICAFTWLTLIRCELTRPASRPDYLAVIPRERAQGISALELWFLDRFNLWHDVTETIKWGFNWDQCEIAEITFHSTTGTVDGPRQFASSRTLMDSTAVSFSVAFFPLTSKVHWLFVGTQLGAEMDTKTSTAPSRSDNDLLILVYVASFAFYFGPILSLFFWAQASSWEWQVIHCRGETSIRCNFTFVWSSFFLFHGFKRVPERGLNQYSDICLCVKIRTDEFRWHALHILASLHACVTQKFPSSDFRSHRMASPSDDHGLALRCCSNLFTKTCECEELAQVIQSVTCEVENQGNKICSVTAAAVQKSKQSWYAKSLSDNTLQASIWLRFTAKACRPGPAPVVT